MQDTIYKYFQVENESLSKSGNGQSIMRGQWADICDATEDWLRFRDLFVGDRNKPVDGRFLWTQHFCLVHICAIYHKVNTLKVLGGGRNIPWEKLINFGL